MPCYYYLFFPLVLLFWCQDMSWKKFTTVASLQQDNLFIDKSQVGYPVISNLLWMEILLKIHIHNMPKLLKEEKNDL